MGFFGGNLMQGDWNLFFGLGKKGNLTKKREGMARIITRQHLKEDSPFRGKLNTKKTGSKKLPQTESWVQIMWQNFAPWNLFIYFVESLNFWKEKESAKKYAGII
jgi:hypothetical protein